MVMAAIIREKRTGGWVERDQRNKVRCCLGTVLGTDLGNTRYSAAHRYQGDTIP